MNGKKYQIQVTLGNKVLPAFVLVSDHIRAPNTIYIGKTQVNDSDAVIVTDVEGFRYKRNTTVNLKDYFCFYRL